ncbi:class I SAM-dependent methyltransferase [Streptacidiphilus carbonis]|jgi:O-methyltransferase involved in polyketide biosynthesis|uniref:class I SAM-dependent methyltransferase n=1 Tax=Streptacidiphilus carbonis TaxID=105422 RepID=UPI0005AAA51C|nr:class I SAM-dependent methyltransferase [Streptacidiphilus carbonis]
MAASTAVVLDGVPETMLWTLYQRAAEARRPDTVLPDPEAVSLVEAVAESGGYPFAERFGHPHPLAAQALALRSACFDTVVREFLDAYPDGTVVSLGEGLETAFWRCDNGRVRWLTVDLPESLAVRHSLLPHGSRQPSVACDARDPAWTKGIDPARGVLVLAQGLLMYFRPPEVRELIAVCAEHFPGGGLVFDAVPRTPGRPADVAARRGPPVARGYRLPPMPWRMNAAERPKLAGAHPGIAEIRSVELPPGRGLLWGLVVPRVLRLPVLSNRRPTVTLLRFASR